MLKMINCLNLLKKYLLYVVLMLIVLCCGIWGVYWAFYNGVLRMNHPSLKEFPIHGIDISHHQGDIQWHKLDKKYVQFVFVKATEGQDFKDKKFQININKAFEQDIPVGAYHFFTFCSKGRSQAEHFIREVPKGLLPLPPAVDLEFGRNCQSPLSEAQLIQEIQDYIQIIERYYQTKVVIYATEEFYQFYLTDQFLDNPLWIRDIYKRPNLKGDRKWVFWQYANREKLEGINSFVDFNVFYADQKKFNEFISVYRLADK